MDYVIQLYLPKEISSIIILYSTLSKNEINFLVTLIKQMTIKNERRIHRTFSLYEVINEKYYERYVFYSHINFIKKNKGLSAYDVIHKLNRYQTKQLIDITKADYINSLYFILETLNMRVKNMLKNKTASSLTNWMVHRYTDR